MRLQGKTALVTGASRNIGKQIALTFAREGADLILNALKSQDALEQVAAQCRDLGAETVTVMGDVSDPASVSRIVADGMKTMKKIDILISTVAIRPYRSFLDISMEEWRRVFDVNLHAAFYLMQEVLPGMIKNGRGSIIALGGKAAMTGSPKTAAVGAAKTGLLGLIRAVAAEMAPYQIRANMVHPGPTETQREQSAWQSASADKLKGESNILKNIPLGRKATVDDIANACLFLASDEAAYITGEQINVVGGRFMI